MLQYPTFDDIGSDDEEAQSGYVPFQFRKEKDDENTLKWLNDNFNASYMSSRDRLMTYRRLCNRYKNAGDAGSGGYMRDSNRDSAIHSDKPKIRTNFFVEYLDQKVSQASKTKQNPSFIPLNDSEEDDIRNAEACGMLVKFRMKELNLDKLMRKQDRMTFKYGHSFARIYWDKNAGCESEEYKRVTAKHGKTLPVFDENGNKVSEREVSDHEAKLGDVGIEIVDTDCVFPERRKKSWEKVDFVDFVEMVSIDELKAEYADEDIKKEDYFWLDIDGKGYNQDDQVMKHTFIHRPTKYLEYGEVIIYVEGKILERITDKEELKSWMPDKQLPFVPDIDIESEDEFWGRPFLINIEQHNNMYDLIQSGIARNIGVASHPKLLIAEGSVNLKQADNKYGVMQWRGPNKPEWMQHNYVNRGEFEIQDRLEKRMDKAAKIYDISKGTVPTGITATSALRLLDDQELQANSETITKRRDRVKAIYWKVVSMMAAKYKPEDGRMARILGENNEYLIQSFSKFDFGKIYSVDIENVSALSDTRSGRVSDIIDLNAANQKEPTFGRKEIIKLLDLGLEKAFVDEISQAATTSKALLEMLKNGQEAMSPEETDDLIEMYSIFSRYVESINYKLKIKPSVKASIKDYIAGLEYLMAEKSQQNMAFAMRVKEFSKYPMFYKPGAVITAMPAPMPEPQGKPSDKWMDNINEKAMQETEALSQNGGIV